MSKKEKEKKKKKKAPVQTDLFGGDSPPVATVPEDGEKRRGRPPGSKSGGKGPAGEKAVRAKRKSPDDIKDTRAAIQRYHDDQKKLVERYRKEHPGTLVADPSDPFKSVVHERIPAKFFRDTLVGGLRPVYVATDKMSAFPAEEQFQASAVLWEETSVHFEMSKWIILSAAIVTTVGLVVPAVALRIAEGPDAKMPPRDIVVRRVASVPVEEPEKASE